MCFRPLALSLLTVALVPGAAGADEPCAPVKPCEIPDDEPAPAREAPAEFTAEARALFDLVSCRGKPPAGLDAAVVKEFCGRQAPRLDRARSARAQLDAAVAPRRPARLPSSVVSPLSDAGLLAALSAYPAARNVTTVTPRRAGDPRLASLARDPGRLRAFLAQVEGDTEVLAWGSARGREGEGSRDAAALPVLLAALAAAGEEPVGLRFFRVEPTGTLHYLGPAEIAAMEQAGGPGPFASCEVEFGRPGQPGERRVVRHLGADLSDRGVAASPAPLAHLASKGPVAVLLAGAGELAGDGYGRLRELTLRQAAVVVSDGSGPTAEQLRQAGLSQEVKPLPGAGKGAVVAVARRG
jgi:hypothetical protein